MQSETTLAVATWNVHRTVGADGKADAARIESVISDRIAPLLPQVLALQEADSDDHPHSALLSSERIERATALNSVHEPQDMRWGGSSGGFLGNILFIDPKFANTDRRVIELPGHCPRAAILIEARIEGVPVRIVSCHLSLSQALRMVQMRLIGQVIARRTRMQTILLGDLNEWRPWGGLALSRRVSGLDLRGSRVATFPVSRPLLALDRVLTDRGAVRDVSVLDGPMIEGASDHRPLFARVSLQRNDVE